MARDDSPQLTRQDNDGIVVWTDIVLLDRCGVLVAFSERGGGVSDAPFDSLNLAAHVGDAPAAVDENRSRLLASVGLAQTRSQLTLAAQVHGADTALVDLATAGSGAFAAHGPPPVPGADALATRLSGVPLLLCFADCVPIVLVAPGPAISVVHAGWRGALASLPAAAVFALAEAAGCETAEIVAYLGPHVGACHYDVGTDILSQFFNTFGTVARARTGGLDLDAVVRKSLIDAGVAKWRITSLGVCTAEATESFFSYRAERGITGRHGALACIVTR